jgi:hypothetical protein
MTRHASTTKNESAGKERNGPEGGSQSIPACRSGNQSGVAISSLSGDKTIKVGAKPVMIDPWGAQGGFSDVGPGHERAWPDGGQFSHRPFVGCHHDRFPQLN